MKDYTGLKANKLTAISFIERKNKVTYWKFKCDCGNYKITNAAKVFMSNPTVRSCGCIKIIAWRKVVINNKKKSDAYIYPIKRTQKSYYYDYKSSAKKRNYSFDISFDLFMSLVTSNCFYCNSKPNKAVKMNFRGIIYPEFICNGVDRKNNKKGYSIENCVPCCINCNRAKNTMDFIAFVDWINFIKTQPKI